MQDVRIEYSVEITQRDAVKVRSTGFATYDEALASIVIVRSETRVEPIPLQNLTK